MMKLKTQTYSSYGKGSSHWKNLNDFINKSVDFQEYSLMPRFNLAA